MGDLIERRERFPMTQVVELSTGEGPDIAAQGVNISETGFLCRTDTGIKPGTYVTFKLPIVGTKRPMIIDCEGHVLKCNEKDGKFDVVIDFTSDACHDL